MTTRFYFPAHCREGPGDEFFDQSWRRWIVASRDGSIVEADRAYGPEPPGNYRMTSCHWDGPIKDGSMYGYLDGYDE